MRAFPSVRSEHRLRIVAALAGIYLVAHLPFLAPSLEDIDSINFALGLRDFDVAQHQPHPPGYPVYIALGRASLALINVVAPGLAQVRAEALALAVWSAIAGAIALVAAAAFFRRLGEDADASSSLWAVVLLAVAPLFWMSGLRPMSDMPGLAAALVAQALFARTIRVGRALPGPPGEPDTARPTVLMTGALVAGLAAGIRVQTLALTMPLFAYALWTHRRAGARWLLLSIAAVAAGAFAWAVPLLIASGGLDGYLLALGTQAGEDFAWVDMLWANPTPRRLAFALYETFVLPWGPLPLAAVVLIGAIAGAVVVLLRDRRPALLLALAFAPYALFHLLLQETFHVRYALPIVPAVAWLSVRGLTLHGAARPVAVIAVALAAAAYSVRGSIAYGSEPHPAFRAAVDMEAAAAATPPAAIYSHYALRRPLQAAALPGLRIVEPRREYEWLGLVDYWRGGGKETVWFVADSRRTDLALIDPHSRREVAQYRWQVAERSELGGARPTDVDWYRLAPARWFAGEGWSLTPEVGGITRAAGSGLDRRPIEAYVRRGQTPMHMVVGGRHLGNPAEAAVFDLTLDGVQVDTWTFDPAKEGLNFLRFIALPAGVPPGDGAYARLVIAARAAIPGRPTPAVTIRQFDIQPLPRLIHGFAEGWHEDEFDNATGLRWRWTSGRSVIRVAPPQGVRLRLRGESPLKYLDAPPRVRVTAGDRELAAFAPADDFEWTVEVPADAVAAAGGAIAIETAPVYLPGPAEGTADERHLGLRLFTIDVEPVP